MQDKKQYQTPQMYKYGSVQQMTKANISGSVTDGARDGLQSN